MDLQKLRPTYSQWRTPVAANDGRARVSTHTQPPLRPPPPPPKGKGGELWCKFFEQAVATSHPEPEKLADSLLRARERSAELTEARPKIMVTTKQPKPQEAAVAAKEKKGRVMPHEAFRCKAKTLAGKQCPFKATCTGFCSKHQVAAPFAIPAK